MVFPIAERFPPPAPLFVEKDDWVCVAIWSSKSGQIVRVRGRLMNMKGDVLPFEETITYTATLRTVQEHYFRLPEGFLLHLAVIDGTGVERGRTYVRVAMGRDLFNIRNITAVLLADYLCLRQMLGWPPGVIRSPREGGGYIYVFAGSDPAAGAEISETVPSSMIWRVRGMYFKLVTDATVVDRRVSIAVTDGTRTIMRMKCLETQPAGLTYWYTAIPGLGLDETVRYGGLRIPLPPDLLVKEGYVIKTLTDNLQAGDNYGPPYIWVEEWLEET